MPLWRQLRPIIISAALLTTATLATLSVAGVIGRGAGERRERQPRITKVVAEKYTKTVVEPRYDWASGDRVWVPVTYFVLVAEDRTRIAVDEDTYVQVEAGEVVTSSQRR